MGKPKGVSLRSYIRGPNFTITRSQELNIEFQVTVLESRAHAHGCPQLCELSGSIGWILYIRSSRLLEGLPFAVKR